MKTEAVFLDRDGTINEEVGYLDSLERLVIYPRAPEAIKILNESRMKVVVVTNQSGVARGYFTEDFVTSVHERMQEVLAKRQAHLDALYYCPHHPEGLGAYRRKCPCRKPEPGMLFAAAREMDLDLSHSYDFAKRELVSLSKKTNAGNQLDIVQNPVEVKMHDPLEEEIRSFLQAVRGRTAPLVSGEDALPALEAAAKIMDKIGSGAFPPHA